MTLTRGEPGHHGGRGSAGLHFDDTPFVGSTCTLSMKYINDGFGS